MTNHVTDASGEQRQSGAFQGVASVAASSLAVLCSTALILSIGFAQELKRPLITSELGGRELTFLTKANEHGVLMMYLAETLQTKSAAKPVQALGELLASTQSEESSRLIQLAAGKGMSFKALTPTSLKRLQTRLGSLTGPAYDKAVIGETNLLIKETIANCEAGAKSKDPDVQAFAAQSLELAKEKLSIATKVAEAPAAEGK